MRIVWCLLVASGCATIDDGFALEIDASNTPLVVVKDGDGPWQHIATTPDGLAYVQIHETSYGVGALCSDEYSRNATFLFDTQPRTVFLPCPISTPFTTSLHVRGTTEPRATVWLANRSVRADADGRFDLQLYEAGLHDVVAILPTAPPKIVAHRAIVIAGDTVVDLPASDAVEMTAVYPQILDATEGLELSSDLNTGTDWIALGTSPSTVYVPPASFLLPTDRPAIAVRDGDCMRQHPLSAANEPFELPTPLAHAVDRTQITWTADAAVPWDFALLDLSTFGESDSSYRAFSSASWREATGSSSIPIVDLAALPGWTNTLARVEADKQVSVSFFMSHGAPDGDYTSCSADEDIARW